jgi:hypothetical protein
MNVWLVRADMDANDIADKIKKYWMALFPKSSGELSKSREPIKVCVLTDQGYREVVGVRINDSFIQLILDKE